MSDLEIPLTAAGGSFRCSLQTTPPARFFECNPRPPAVIPNHPSPRSQG